MNGDRKSDKPIVPEKDANKERGKPRPAERLEERGLAKGNPGEQSRYWTQGQTDLSHALDRIRNAMLQYPRQEPGAVIPHAGICEGAAREGGSYRGLTRAETGQSQFLALSA